MKSNQVQLAELTEREREQAEFMYRQICRFFEGTSVLYLQRVALEMATQFANIDGYAGTYGVNDNADNRAAALTTHCDAVNLLAYLYSFTPEKVRYSCV